MEIVDKYGQQLTKMGDCIESELVKVDDFIQKSIKQWQSTNVPRGIQAVVAIVVLLVSQWLLSMAIIKFGLVLALGAIGNERFYHQNTVIKMRHIVIVLVVWMLLAFLF